MNQTSSSTKTILSQPNNFSQYNPFVVPNNTNFNPNSSHNSTYMRNNNQNYQNHHQPSQNFSQPQNKHPFSPVSDYPVQVGINVPNFEVVVGNSLDSSDYSSNTPNAMQRMRSQNELEMNQDRSPVAAARLQNILRKASTFTTLQPIAENPGNDSSDIMESASPESNYQDLSKMDQTLLDQYEQSDRASQGRPSLTATPISVRGNVTPSFSPVPNPLQLQKIQGISSYMSEEFLGSASVRTGPGLNNQLQGLSTAMSTTSTYRNLLTELDDDEPTKDNLLHAKFSKMPPRSNSAVTIPSLIPKNYKLNIDDKQPGAHQEPHSSTIKSHNFGDGLVARKDQCLSAVFKPKGAARTLNMDDEDDDEDFIQKALPLTATTSLNTTQSMIGHPVSRNISLPVGATAILNFDVNNAHNTQPPVNTSNMSYTAVKLLNLKASEPNTNLGQSRSALLKPKESFLTDLDEKEEFDDDEQKPQIRESINKRSPQMVQRHVSENNLPELKFTSQRSFEQPEQRSPLRANTFSTSKMTDFAINEAPVYKPMPQFPLAQSSNRILNFSQSEHKEYKPATPFQVGQSFSAMLPHKGGMNLFSEFGSNKQCQSQSQSQNQSQLNPFGEQSAIKRGSLPINRCVSENAIPIIPRKFAHESGFANQLEPTSSCTVPRALEFGSDDSDVSFEADASQKVADEKMDIEEKGSSQLTQMCTEYSSSPDVKQPFSAKQPSSANLNVFATQSNQFRPNPFSQFSTKVQRSATECNISVGRSMPRTNSFGMCKDDWNSRYFENLRRFERDFDIIEMLGCNDFAITYKCQNRLDHQEYVVKITKKKLKGTENISQTLNETQASSSLGFTEPNNSFVRFYNAWVEQEQLFILTEYCKQNLNQIQTSGTSPTEEMVQTLIKDICSALKILHDKEIVHLHIKPENILLSKNNTYKISDLGVSKLSYQTLLEESENKSAILNDIMFYLAPELFNECSEDSAPDLTKSDIFSLGVTLYQFIMNVDFRHDEKSWNDLKAEDFQIFDELPYSPTLKDVIKSMIDERPDSRPSASDILKDLFRTEAEIKVEQQRSYDARLKVEVEDMRKQLRIKRKKSM